MKVYGLTGGIASGKSTVSRLLRARGVPIIDADEVAREVVEPGTPGLAAIVDTFGVAVLRTDGTLDREGLARLVFHDEQARQKLNRIVHPLVQGRMAEKAVLLASQGEPLAFMDIPLLFEARDPSSFAGVVVVYVDAATQLERLMRRNGYSREEAEARIRSQMSLEEKKARATYVVDNSGSEAETEAQVALLIAQLRAEATQDA